MFVGLNPPPPQQPVPEQSQKQMVLPTDAEIALKKLEEIQATEVLERKESSKQSRSRSLKSLKIKVSSKDFHSHKSNFVEETETKPMNLKQLQEAKHYEVTINQQIEAKSQLAINKLVKMDEAFLRR